jgi:hypothetical protein
MSTNKTLQDVAHTATGSFVSGPFSGTLMKTAERTSTKTGKPFYVAKLTDGLITIDVSSFSHNLSKFEGQWVTISGQKIVRGEDYNSMPKITIGDKAVITSNGAGAAPAQSIPLAQTGHPSATNTPSAPAPHRNEAPRNEGIVIGACLNKAVDVCIAAGDTSESAIWQIASRLLRVSNRLQKGELHTPSTAEEALPEGADNEQPY